MRANKKLLNYILFCETTLRASTDGHENFNLCQFKWKNSTLKNEELNAQTNYLHEQDDATRKSVN